MKYHSLFSLRTRYCFTGILLFLVMAVLAVPATAVISEPAGKIEGQPPAVSGRLLVLFPDGKTVVTNNAIPGLSQIPDQFMLSASTEALELQDADGDTGLNAVVDTESATLTWKDGDTVLTAEQLTAPFGEYLAGRTLTLDVSAPVTARSETGKPTTAEPKILFSSYTLTVPLPGIAVDDFSVTGEAISDGKASNILTAIVKDEAGNVLPGAKVIFTVTDGAATPATQTVETNEDGIATGALVSTVTGDNQVTATVANVVTGPKTTRFVALMTQVVAGGSGNTFALDAGFPTTGYVGANFNIQMKGNAGAFSWEADQSWVAVDTAGKVTFTGIPTSGTRKATITATPDAGGTVQTYSFTVSKWYVNGGTATHANAFAYCESRGYGVPTYTDISDKKRGRVGLLWGEWAMSGWNAEFYWLNGFSGDNWMHRIRVSDGGQNNSTINADPIVGVICSMDTTSVVDGSTTTIASGDLTVTADNALADGLATNAVQARVTNGGPVMGQTVTFKASNGADITPSAITDSNGIATATLTNTLKGITTVHASVNNSEQSVDTTFVADESTAVINGVDFIVASGALADGNEANALSATVKDARGNTLTGADVTFNVISGSATPASQTVKTDVNGMAKASIVSTVAGENQVTVTSLGSTPAAKVSAFTAGPVDSAKSSLAVSPESIVANGTATSELTFTARDANNNPLSGRTVTFTKKGTGSFVSDFSAVTENTNGVYTATLTAGTTAGQVTVAVAVDGSTVSGTNNSKIVTLTQTPADSAKSSLTVSPASIVANGTATSELTFTARDANNNPLLGRTVAFATSGTGSAGVKVGSVKESNGVYTATLTAGTTAGQVTVAVAVDGSTVSGTNNSKVVTLTPAASITGVIINGKSYSAEAGAPDVAFPKAAFQIQVNGGTATNNEYTWTVSPSKAASVATDGTVTFSNISSSEVTKQIIVKATPKSGGNSFEYKIDLIGWFTPLTGTYTYDGARSNCSSIGMMLPSIQTLVHQWSVWGDSRGYGIPSTQWSLGTPGNTSQPTLNTVDGTQTSRNASGGAYAGASCWKVL